MESTSNNTSRNPMINTVEAKYMYKYVYVRVCI